MFLLLLGESWIVSLELFDITFLLLFIIQLTLNKKIYLSNAIFIGLAGLLAGFLNLEVSGFLEKFYVLVRPLFFSIFIFYSRISLHRLIVFIKWVLAINIFFIFFQFFDTLLPQAGDNWHTAGNPGYAGIFKWTITNAYFSFFALAFAIYYRSGLWFVLIAFFSLTMSFSLYYTIAGSMLLYIRYFGLKRFKLTTVIAIAILVVFFSSGLEEYAEQSIMFSRLGIVWSVGLFFVRSSFMELTFGLGYDPHILYDTFSKYNIFLPHVMINNITIGLEDMLLFGGVVFFGVGIWSLYLVSWWRYLRVFLPMSLVVIVFLGLAVNQNLYSGFFTFWLVLLIDSNRRYAC